MNEKEKILQLIKASVNKTEPDATLILFGSRARGDHHESSDIDLLILLDKEELTRSDQKRIKYPLYGIEFETGTIISPILFAKKEWESLHRKTPFYENVIREGQIL